MTESSIRDFPDGEEYGGYFHIGIGDSFPCMSLSGLWDYLPEGTYIPGIFADFQGTSFRQMTRAIFDGVPDSDVPDSFWVPINTELTTEVDPESFSEVPLRDITFGSLLKVKVGQFGILIDDNEHGCDLTQRVEEFREKLFFYLPRVFKDGIVRPVLKGVFGTDGNLPQSYVNISDILSCRVITLPYLVKGVFHLD
jgi:hypothetical protein